MKKIDLSEHFTFKKLLLFSIPSIFMMIISCIYGIVDGLFITNIIGDDAFTGINLIMPVVMIVGTIGTMFGTGGGALISKFLGEGDKEKANRLLSTFSIFIFILTAIIGFILIILIEPISSAIGADESTIQYCVPYGRILLAFMPFYALQLAYQNLIIVAGKPHFGLIITIIAGLVNGLFDFLFIYVFNFGVQGAAFATILSQVFGAIIPLVYFFRKKSSSLIHFEKPILDFKDIGKAAYNGSSEMASNVSMSLVNMLYNIQLLQIFGKGGVSAYGTIMYVGFIFIGTFFGFSMSVVPIMGYNLGAKRTDELHNVFKKSLIIITTFSLVLTMLAEALSYPLAFIFFSKNQELLDLTTIAIRIYALSYLLSGFNIFGSSMFTGLNNGFVSALISFSRTLIFQVVMIFIIPLIFGPYGIWAAMLFAEFFSLIVTVVSIIVNHKRYGYY